MSARTLGAIGGILTALATALGLGLFVSRSAAAEKVEERLAPVMSRVTDVENRVTRLEAQRIEDVKKIDEIRADVKVLLERVPPRR
jgi:hypothetical protein